jgi:F-type H+-transporting ATPase subunit b
MMRRQLPAFTALLLGTASPLLAQEHGGGGGGLLSPEPGLIIWTIIIFAIVLGVLGKFAYPKILGAVEAREEHLRELIEGAERDRAEAARLRAEQEAAMAQARQHAQEAVAEGRAFGEKEGERIIAEAQHERAEILVRAEREIAAERAAAMEQVRRDAADLAIAAAEKLVRRTLSSEDDRRIVSEYLASVEPRGTAAAGV